MIQQTIPPDNNEIELSLFGPGVGECILVHFGDGNWMVVDSCMDTENGIPVALKYLEDMGIDIAKQVKLAIVTHWHDDHIRGFSDILRRASSAKFACSAALSKREFFILIAADDQIKLIEETSGINEFKKILNIIEQRSKGESSGPDFWASEGNLLYRDNNQNIEVWALSPSAQTITDSAMILRDLMPQKGATFHRLSSPEPNELSVALMIKISNLYFLLGADLENGKNPRRGWQAVINSDVLPTGMNCIYKVAHHGSKTADIDGIWTKLLIKQPTAILTPFHRGSKPLPSDEDLSRILKYTNEIYCTYNTTSKSPARRDPAVERTIKEISGKKLSAIRRKPGHIRVRISSVNSGSKWNIDLFDGAQKMP